MKQANKVKMQRPDFSVSKNNAEKGYQLVENFLNGAKKSVKEDAKNFSTISTFTRMLKKDQNDPSDKHVLNAVKRMQQDKLNSQVAMQISQITTERAQSMQMQVLMKMIPFFLGLLGLCVLGALIAFERPFVFDTTAMQIKMSIFTAFVPVFIWGLARRKEAQLDMLATNIVLQASAAFASAKMQGRGQIGALQNLNEMRVKAKKMEAEKKAEKKKAKK